MHLSQIDFLRHIQKECIYLIQESSDNSFEDFLHDERLSRAICRSLEIIGEASAKIHPDFKAKYPLVPWRDMNDIRNKIIHHYFGIDYDIVWDTVKTNIPILKESIDVIIEKEGG
jgi:uncharacterized protein with HEPN domain